MYRYKLNKNKIKEKYKALQGITLNNKDWFESKIELTQLKSYIENGMVIEEIIDNSGHVLKSSITKEETLKKEPEKPVKPIIKARKIKQLESEKKEFEISEKTLKMMDKSIENYKAEKKIQARKKRAVQPKKPDIDLNDYFLTV